MSWVVVSWIAVAIAGALGAVARFLVSQAAIRRLGTRLPWGTVLVNVSGAFAAGAIGGLLTEAVLPAELGRVVAGGFLGAYTTFSTAMVETLQLREHAGSAAAITHLLAESLAALAAAGLGWWVVMLWT